MKIPEGKRHWERKKSAHLLRDYLSSLVSEEGPLLKVDIDILCNVDWQIYGGKWDYNGDTEYRKALSLPYKVIDELVDANVQTEEDVSGVLSSRNFLNNMGVNSAEDFDKIYSSFFTLLLFAYAHEDVGGLGVNLDQKSDRLLEINDYISNSRIQELIQPKIDCILERIYQPDE